jgi:hypothetical protein
MSETNTPPRGIQRALVAGLDRAIGIHQSVVAAHVRRIRDRHPEASPSDVIALLEKQYLATVIGTGAAAGGVAAAPGVGTAAAVMANAGEMVSFLERYYTARIDASAPG